MTTSERPLDIVVLGAYGRTARECAEYIATQLPSNLKWAIAGRNAGKLQALAEKLKGMNSDRLQPEVAILELNPKDLGALARKCRVIINGVAPYCLHSLPVVEACATNGTHYLDFSGEVPWTKELIEKYHETAKANRAIIMPSTAMESAFSDILAWLVATTMRGLHSCDTGEVVCRETAVIQEGLLPSLQGGIPTAMSVIDKYGIGWLLSPKPWALSPEPKPTKLDGSSSSLGYKNVSGLGTLSTSPIAIINRSVVNRSWGLMPETYGPHFHYQEYLPSRNAFTAMLIHIATKIGFLLLGVPLVRWLIRCSVKLLPYILPPENAGHHQKDHFEFRAIGTADGTKNKARVGARFAYDGSGYWLCAFIAVEAAVVLLKEEETQMKKKMGGGLLTPSTLGMVYVERLRKAGATIEAEAMV